MRNDNIKNIKKKKQKKKKTKQTDKQTQKKLTNTDKTKRPVYHFLLILKGFSLCKDPVCKSLAVCDDCNLFLSDNRPFAAEATSLHFCAKILLWAMAYRIP